MIDLDKFYSDRVNNFDNERQLFSKYEKMITASKKDLHTFTWETRKQEAILEEKKRVCESLDRELAQVKEEYYSSKKQLSDMEEAQATRLAQIKTLEGISLPVEHDITYLYPDRLSNSGRIGKMQRSQQGEDTCNVTAPKNEIKLKEIRTADILNLEKMLQSETEKVFDLHHQFKVRAHDTITTVAKKRDKIQMSSALRSEADNLRQQIERTNRECYQGVKDLLGLRLKIMVAQRQEMEELDRLQNDRKYFALKEEQTREQLVLEMQLVKDRLKAELKDSTSNLQYQIEQLQRQIEVMSLKTKRQLESEKHEEENMKKQTEKLRLVKDRYEKLRRRSALEMEGYQNEMAMLRTRLQQLQKKRPAIRGTPEK